MLKKLMLAIGLLLVTVTVANAQDYYRYRYPDRYPPYSVPGYYGYGYPYAYPGPGIVVAPPPVYAPPVVIAPPPYIDPGLAMFNFWAGIVVRGVNCMPRYVGRDAYGRPVYQPVC